jgi:hypothetical protein
VLDDTETQALLDAIPTSTPLRAADFSVTFPDHATATAA